MSFTLSYSLLVVVANVSHRRNDEGDDSYPTDGPHDDSHHVLLWKAKREKNV